MQCQSLTFCNYILIPIITLLLTNCIHNTHIWKDLISIADEIILLFLPTFLTDFNTLMNTARLIILLT